MTYRLVAEGFDSDALLASVEELLEANVLCSLATTSQGKPHINTAYVAILPGLNLAILTPPNSQHAANVAQEPATAMAVYDSHQPFGADLQGLQLFGFMKLLDGAEAEVAYQCYVRRFPGLAKWAQDYSALEVNLESRFYGLEVDRVKIFNERRFGKEVYIVARVHR